MELSDRFVVKASSQDAWALFWDLPRVAQCLPGCEDIQARGDTGYRAQFAQKVGPFQITMNLDLNVDEMIEEKRVTVSGAGQDRMGNRLKVNRLALELGTSSSGETEVSSSMDFNLYGRLATLGHAVVKRKAEETRAEFSRRIAAELGS